MKHRTAEIIREFGPFPGIDDIAGVSFDRERVWFASGDRLNALDPESGEITGSIATAADAGTAVFYSISNCQEGLRGISFGNFLIKRVAEALSRDLPNLKTFSTLSPIPGFKRWLGEAVAKGTPHLLKAEDRKALKAATGGAFAKGEFIRLLEDPEWTEKEEVAAALKAPLMRLAARYLAQEKGRGQLPLDPVARFHLGNGAQIEQLDWLADLSDKGLKQSAGMMVNYLYKLSEVEKNHEGFARDGRVAMSSKIKDLL